MWGDKIELSGNPKREVEGRCVVPFPPHTHSLSHTQETAHGFTVREHSDR